MIKNNITPVRTPYPDSLDPEIAIHAEELAEEILLDVDIEGIAYSLSDELNGPYIEEVWDSSGGTLDGYVYPSERAFEMLEEIIDPYINEMMDYLKRNMKDH